MPLFTGRVGALREYRSLTPVTFLNAQEKLTYVLLHFLCRLAPQYSVDRSAYFDPSQSNPPITFLEVSSLSSLKLSYGISRNPLEKCTLWEYAVRNAKSWVMPSLSSLKRKIGQALELAIREDEEFWNTINETE